MKSYMRTLRTKIGHVPVIQCGASVIVVNDVGEILLQKRKDNGCWGYHGGSVELNETVEEAAKRELCEETGLTAEELNLFGVFSGPDMYYVYPNGDEVSNIDVVFICRSWWGTMRVDDTEVDELRFFSPDNIPENISPPNRKALERFLKEQRKPENGGT